MLIKGALLSKKTLKNSELKMATVHRREKGFTLLEVLIVVSIIGLIAAIAAPTWFSFLEARRLSAVRDKLYVGMRDAQVKAQIQSAHWQFSVRESNGRIEWATHPESVDAQLAQWQKVEDSQSVQLDAETTFDKTSDDVRYIIFNDDGNTELRYLGRITLSAKNAPSIKRCVIASTIIGAFRKSKEQATPDPDYRRKDRFCY
ncbi:MAG: prepilin-type N-terminal cleavage/methylation domain-containing protein [Cyanobacteria bacterium J06634_6]